MSLLRSRPNKRISFSGSRGPVPGVHSNAGSALSGNQHTVQEDKIFIDYGERFARHWSDIACLDKVGFADSAIADRTLAQEVAAHKSVFFAEKTGGQMISYQDAIKGKLKLIPEGACRDALAKDYNDMELLFDSKPCSFDELMQLCRSLEERANKFG